MFPPLPPWEGLHPLVVHFPIALLLTAPLFVLAAAVLRRGRAAGLAALTLMVLGVVSAFVATASGEAAGELADHAAGAGAVLERHEEAAELVRNLFAGLTLVYAVVLLLPPGERVARWKLSPAVTRSTQVVFLLLYLPAVVLLARAAHEGGRLVHEFGVRAILNTGSSGAPDVSQPRLDDD